MGCTLHITESLVDEIRDCLGKAVDRAVGLTFRFFRQIEQLRKRWNISCWREKVVVVVGNIRKIGLQFGERGAGWLVCAFVRQDYGLGFDLQMTVLGKHIELMDPVSVSVVIGSHTGRGRGREPKRETALAIVVKRTQANFVIALRDRSVVLKFSDMNEVISVQATAP